MTQQMSTREKTLAMIVGAMVFTLVTYLLLTQFQKVHSRLRGQLRDKQAQLSMMQTLITERDLWLKRDEWLRSRQPVLSTAGSETTALIDEIKEIAQKHSVLIENPQYGTAETKANYQLVNVTLDTKSKWDNLVEFLYEMQSPTTFIVFEKCTITLDATDKTQVRGKFTLAKWFAPKA